MPTVTATATLQNDITYTLLSQGSNQQAESGQTNYSVSLSTPTGTPSSLEINYGLQTSGTTPAGGKSYFNFQSFTKDSFGATQQISFTEVKGISIENQATEYGHDLILSTSGGTAWTDPWNGSNGSSVIKPYSSWQYGDPISGSAISSSNTMFYIEDTLGSGINYSIVVVGVTG